MTQSREHQRYRLRADAGAGIAGRDVRDHRGQGPTDQESGRGGFFIWVNLAYLQPFEDGNKCTSRLAANIPLMLYNCAPLSFNDVAAQDYALAMMGVYEFLDVSLAADMFAWTYRRSLQKYVVVLDSMGAPDPARLRYRGALNDAIQRLVRERETLEAVLSSLGLSEESAPEFRRLLADELRILGVHNCARYRLSIGATAAWVAAGRPT